MEAELARQRTQLADLQPPASRTLTTSLAHLSTDLAERRARARCGRARARAASPLRSTRLAPGAGELRGRDRRPSRQTCVSVAVDIDGRASRARRRARRCCRSTCGPPTSRARPRCWRSSSRPILHRGVERALLHAHPVRRGSAARRRDPRHARAAGDPAADAARRTRHAGRAARCRQRTRRSALEPSSSSSSTPPAPRWRRYADAAGGAAGRAGGAVRRRHAERAHPGAADRRAGASSSWASRPWSTSSRQRPTGSTSPTAAASSGLSAAPFMVTQEFGPTRFNTFHTGLDMAYQAPLRRPDLRRRRRHRPRRWAPEPEVRRLCHWRRDRPLAAPGQTSTGTCPARS